MSKPKSKALATELTASALEMSFDEMSKKVEIFERFIKSNLKEETDYGIASEHQGSKPTLLKPGSEKLCLLINARPQFVRDNEMLEHLNPSIREETIALLCQLINRTDGTILGEGRGSCSVWKQSKGSKILDVNRALKMAEKRAQMDAVLRVAALSGRFTQDLEDAEYKDEREHQPRQHHIQPTVPRPAGYVREHDRGFPPTKAQLNCITAKWLELQPDEQEKMREVMAGAGIVKENLSKKQASFVIDEIQRVRRMRKAQNSPINVARKIEPIDTIIHANVETKAIADAPEAFSPLTDENVYTMEHCIRAMPSLTELEQHMHDVRAFPKTLVQQARFNLAYEETKASLLQTA